MINQAPADAPGNSNAGILVVKSITKQFTTPDGPLLAIDGVSLSVKPGEFLAVIGPSGCGKSTFLRVLNRMHELIPSASMAGEVLLDARPAGKGSHR